MFDQEYVKGCKAEKNKGIPGQAISKSLPARSFKIFLHGERPDVTHATPIKVTRSRVVNAMLPTPLMKRREGKHTGDKSDDLIRLARWEK